MPRTTNERKRILEARMQVAPRLVSTGLGLEVFLRPLEGTVAVVRPAVNAAKLDDVLEVSSIAQARRLAEMLLEAADIADGIAADIEAGR
jgi:hypothetical protein